MKLELITLGIIVVFIAAFAYISSSRNHEWSGADDQPKNVINDMTHGSYHPWFNNVWEHVWEPPSSDIESLLFALQAAFGSLIIGYLLGYYRGLAKVKAPATSEVQDGGLGCTTS